MYKAIASLFLILLLYSCNRNSETITEAPNPSPTPDETIAKSPSESPPSPTNGELSQICTNKQIGYSINYPGDWETNSGNVVEACQVFDPDVPQLPEATETFDEAVFIRIAPISLEKITTKGSGQTELSREKADLSNDKTAVVIEAESTGQGLLPKGLKSYRYYMEMGEETLIAETFDVEKQDYERNKEVLDQMMQTLVFN
ncbi:MAG: hypothetical protein SAJ12_14850 [Jaaginema sp. PMC 1079.18]|nr:hypothetical protein [Jaaginema sp. PMC 1080.18]MEC4852264.1 hypothetical protein [Jaaginema sp. PMC 1079.18]MEC4866252.1 hypothetical protein [Jaaginema sp. PMC 1078.18]